VPERRDRGHVASPEQPVRLHEDCHLAAVAAGLAWYPAEVHDPVHGPVFETTTVDGDRVSRDLLGAPALVGFFAPGCGPCKERVPEFAAYAEAVSGAGQYTLAVVVGSGEDVREFAGGLGDASRVVVEAPGGPVSTAFGVHGFPALCALDDTGAIVATGTTLDRLPSPLTS
jgi:thiol-disulfide isomerase/thioredoxin